MEDPKCKIKLFFENFQEMFSDGNLSDFRKTVTSNKVFRKLFTLKYQLRDRFPYFCE